MRAKSEVARGVRPTISSVLALAVAISLHLLAAPTPAAAKDASAAASAKKTEVWSIGIPSAMGPLQVGPGPMVPSLKVAASHPYEYHNYPHGGHPYGGYGGGHYGSHGGGYSGGGYGHGGHGGYGHSEFEFGHVSPSYKSSLGCHHKGFDLIPWFIMALGALILIPIFGALIQFKLQALAPLFGFQGQTPLVTTQVGGTRTNIQARLLNEIWPMVDKAIEHYTGMATEELKKEALHTVNTIQGFRAQKNSK
ncbi:shematrin-like protein 2 isoform X2 [Varroa destructor]|uniref:Uncharacterized protein n=1 Tax=Varroa destructor TaxID=109461 RepID=A0A7M7JLF2_VARDE|nr:shematrin-like protein 2 isoform X2 [Varroa destructor]